MSDDPFSQLGPLGDMFRMMLSQQGAGTWEVAVQLAVQVATEGMAEPNVDPTARIQLEQLARVAELQVSNATGLDVSASTLRAAPVNRSQWVERSTGAYRNLLETLAGSLNQGPSEPADDLDPLARMLAPMLDAMRPMLVGVTAGSMLGHLARRSFGQYDLPIPRDGDEFLVVVPNLDEFAGEWSVPPDDLYLWICLHEATHHAVLRVPHVRAAMASMLGEYAGGFAPDVDALGRLFGELDLDVTAEGGLEAMQSRFNDPEVLLGAMVSRQQEALRPRLDALVAAVAGYVDHTMDRMGPGLISSYRMLTEALRRRRVTADPSDRFVERMVGLELTQATYDRGHAFVTGIEERAGAEGLGRLWSDPRHLPTPAEIDAPGLWLARIDLGD